MEKDYGLRSLGRQMKDPWEKCLSEKSAAINSDA
jgi:hypothetical protein